MKKKVLIAMPAYNEAKVISNVIKDIKNEGFKQILVVDDCSSDDTAEVSKKAGAIVLRHKKNKGAGGATYTAMKYAKKNDYDYIVLVDSDGQHSPQDIKKLMLRAPKYDVVIGSRMVGDLSKMPIQRKIANFVGSFVTWFFFGLFVLDSQSGFKVFNKKAMSKIKITFERYEFCSEIIGEIRKHKLTHKEVPIKIKYSNHSFHEKEHGQSILNGFKMLYRFTIYRIKSFFN